MRNFQEHIADLMIGQERVTKINGSIYFIGKIEDFRLRFILRAGNRQGLPEDFLKSEGLKGDPKLFQNILQAIIERNLNTKIEKRIERTYDGEILEYNKIVFVQPDFEKTMLGTFFYLLYLRDLFKEDPNVCVVISDLKPLFSQARKLEMALSLPEKEFLTQFPKYAPVYSDLIEAYNIFPSYTFRLYLLNRILERTGPYLMVSVDDFNVSLAFRSLFKQCQESKARYTVAQNILILEDRQVHANVLIFDKNAKVVERFEPNGSGFSEIAELVDQRLENLARELGYQYLPPSQYCPSFGIQSIESYFREDGFCISWSLLYAEERLRSGVSAYNLLHHIIATNPSLRADTLQGLYSNLELWIVHRINSIFSKMDHYYKELAEELGINVIYQDRSLILK